MSDSSSAFQDAGFSEQIYGLPCLRIKNENSHALVACQGAQVLSWLDKNGKDRLYLSPQTSGVNLQDTPPFSGQPIRGGIPVCFPQFSDRGPLIKHGFVRNRLWALDHNPHADQAHQAITDSVTLVFKDDEATRSAWPHAFHAAVEVKLAMDSLATRITVTNTDEHAISFTVALHTYLRVNDIKNTGLAGLEGIRYQDATNRNTEAIQQEPLLKIESEVDRVYCNAPGKLQLLENGIASLDIEQHGFFDTVIWNPGPEKAQALTDFPDEDWLKMLCVEAACVMQSVKLHPGQSWFGSQALSLA